jgi:hypothetical protein
MKDITFIFLSASIIFMVILNMVRNKRKNREELDGLTILLYMLLTQREADANGVLFTIEKYSEHNRKPINQLRISYLKNVSPDFDGSIRRSLGATFYEASGLLFRSGTARAIEFLEGAGEIVRSSRSRITKVRNEIVNSIGIIFTMVIMFLIVIYFLSPYMGFFKMNNI